MHIVCKIQWGRQCPSLGHLLVHMPPSEGHTLEPLHGATSGSLAQQVRGRMQRPPHILPASSRFCTRRLKVTHEDIANGAGGVACTRIAVTTAHARQRAASRRTYQAAAVECLGAVA